MKAAIAHSVWKVATWAGTRRIGNVANKLPAYADTITYFDDSGNGTTSMDGIMALTIDDGFVRGDSASCSMVKEVLDLLRSFEAHATFMVCTKYVYADGAKMVLEQGSEMGNHLHEDRNYRRLSKVKFREALLETNKFLMDECGLQQSDLRWFRAPQAGMNRGMREVLVEEKMTNVFADCYCDDWVFAESGDTKPVAPLMLEQFDRNGGRGSIAVFHMPERGYRESSIEALKEFLVGMQQRGIRCVTLTEMAERCPAFQARKSKIFETKA